ncbi:hypothetical protein [Gloeothece verrucosa]|uniref:Uncharacterized protein n=1 Tax=Gloeothece verrucosa (strain PCC 7822) TaxID=497965 RepID=E0UCH7_GLOV7|nr:hypothetical protein [Gloeothece verrucosa]ADN14048.1 conserved hypothetical protein [Gloeothece verrucosa PCC 7822]
MIHHISIPAQKPLQVANALAEILEGEVHRFPPVPGSYMVMIDDGQGTGIEVYPLGTQLAPGNGIPEITQQEAIPTFVPFHAAISVPLERERIENIATREGWRVQQGDRGVFQVIELWVENWFMLELLTPDFVPSYLEFSQPQNVEQLLAGPIQA